VAPSSSSSSSRSWLSSLPNSSILFSSHRAPPSDLVHHLCAAPMPPQSSRTTIPPPGASFYSRSSRRSSSSPMSLNPNIDNRVSSPPALIHHRLTWRQRPTTTSHCTTSDSATGCAPPLSLLTTASPIHPSDQRSPRTSSLFLLAWFPFFLLVSFRNKLVNESVWKRSCYQSIMAITFLVCLPGHTQLGGKGRKMIIAALIDRKGGTAGDALGWRIHAASC
jgi:hypothetical protein